MIDKKMLNALVEFAAVCAETDISDEAILGAVHWARLMNKPEPPKESKDKKKRKDRSCPPLPEPTIKDIRDFTNGLDKFKSSDLITVLGIRYSAFTKPYTEALRHMGFERIHNHDFGDGHKCTGFVRVK